MPKRFTGKLCHFLFEHLEQGTFGEQLSWLDRRSGVFQLLWKHGNGGSSSPDKDCAVFMAWDRHKKRRFHCSPLQAKQRFRAAMSKMCLHRLKTWRLHSPKKDFQFRRFPSEDLDYLFKRGKGNKVAPHLRNSSVGKDKASVCSTPKQCPSNAELSSRKLRDAFLSDWSQCDALCSNMPPDEIFGSADSDLLVHCESQDETTQDDLILSDLSGHLAFANNGMRDEEEVIECKCSAKGSGTSRCLFCIVVEYADPPVEPVFRFDLPLPAAVCKT
ncbi:uncharacterized protein LOC144124599 [Amblyomma americanum]